MEKKFMGHGDRPNFDIHLANGSFRIAQTPSGKAYTVKDGKKELLPDDPARYSIVSKENDWDPKESTASWQPGTAEHRRDARKSWGEFLDDPAFQADKLKQIQRSCPICRSML